LVFKLRESDDAISPEEAQAAWHEILKDTLDSADRKKLRPDD
jgi:hypothetical protein